MSYEAELERKRKRQQAGADALLADLLSPAERLGETFDPDLDALVPKPEPEKWRWWSGETRVLHGATFASASACRSFHTGPGYPVRETVDPITGVVTLTPEGV